MLAAFLVEAAGIVRFWTLLGGGFSQSGPILAEFRAAPASIARFCERRAERLGCLVGGGFSQSDSMLAEFRAAPASVARFCERRAERFRLPGGRRFLAERPDAHRIPRGTCEHPAFLRAF